MKAPPPLEQKAPPPSETLVIEELSVEAEALVDTQVYITRADEELTHAVTLALPEHIAVSATLRIRRVSIAATAKGKKAAPTPTPPVVVEQPPPPPSSVAAQVEEARQPAVSTALAEALEREPAMAEPAAELADTSTPLRARAEPKAEAPPPPPPASAEIVPKLKEAPEPHQLDASLAEMLDTSVALLEALTAEMPQPTALVEEARPPSVGEVVRRPPRDDVEEALSERLAALPPEERLIELVAERQAELVAG